MDKGRKMTYAMIEVAVDKALSDIEENPPRGIRNLLDLGTQISSGQFLQDFFRNMQQMLTTDNSPYYRLTKHIILNVNHNIIKKFGIHLVYHSLTYGANKIRKYEKELGYYIPWNIVFDLRQEEVTKDLLSTQEISTILSYSESLGIYCGMFFVNNNQVYLIELIKMLANHRNSAFLIFTEPELMNDDIADEVVKASNIGLVLFLPAENDNQTWHKASNILLNKKCLYGAYCEYNDRNIKQIMNPTYLQKIIDNHFMFIFLIQDELNEAYNIKCFAQFLQDIKANKYPFFVFDFYEELARINRTISGEDCFLTIKGNGQIAINNINSLHTGLNIHTHTLPTILEKTMPKIN